MEICDVLRCSFERWYPSFKTITPESIIIALPDGFVDYLLADTIILPESEQPFRQYSEAGDCSEEEEEETKWDSEETDVPEPPRFEEFDLKIKNSIQKLGGKVFPKLNWSSPCDSSWIGLNNSCCCTNVCEIYLLLKSSSRVAYDVTKPFFYCVDQKDCSSESNAEDQQSVNVPYYLVLRKWMEIDPSAEFRCFVKMNSLIGITQREHSVYFEHIVQERDEILKDIVAFFSKNIKYKFPSYNYVFDVWREKKGQVILIDLNPFGEMTDTLLFDWSELKDIKVENDSLPEFRYVSDNHGVQPKLFCQYSVPTDIVDISTGIDSYKLVDLLKMKRRQQENEDSSDEE